MKKYLIIVCLAATAGACGGRKEATAESLTPEQESQLVDSISSDINGHRDHLQQKADSVTNEVDSLLKDI